jgi:putative flippase GtrA
VNLVAQLRLQWRVLLGEVAKFGVVGAINTVVDFAIFNFLHFGPIMLGGKHIGPLTSQAIATVISATLSYFMNRHWTFRHRARTDLRREYSLFFLLNLVGLAIMEACIGLTRYGFGLDSAVALNSAKVVGLVLGTLFRFWSYKRWVFLADGRLAADPEPADDDDASSAGPPAAAPEVPAAEGSGPGSVPNRSGAGRSK